MRCGVFATIRLRTCFAKSGRSRSVVGPSSFGTICAAIASTPSRSTRSIIFCRFFFPSALSAPGPRRDEADRADVARRALQYLEEDVAAHRAADDGRARHAEMVEQIDDVAGKIAHCYAACLGEARSGERRRAQVGRNRAPSFGNRSEIRFPHRAAAEETRGGTRPC